MERNQTIIKTSIIGIVVNVFLVVLKLTIGLLAGSIAVILDAVNNLGDALSSIITIIGTKLAGRKADKKHPYGYGRIEYLSSVIIAVIVLLAGLTSLKESIEKILHPEAASYTVLSLIILGIAVAAKLFVGRYVKAVGVKIQSQSLIASGSDAFFDAVLSLATLVGGIISMVWGWMPEGWLGALISLVILKAGFEMLLETLNSIIGVRADPELTDHLKEMIKSNKEIRGVYDLILHNYGPTQMIGSVHIEVPDDMTARDIHHLTRAIAEKVYQAYGIILTIGIYASHTSGGLPDVRAYLETLLKDEAGVLEMHGFYAEEETKVISFDLVIDFEADAEDILSRLTEKLKNRYPDYQFFAVIDSDYSN